MINILIAYDDLDERCGNYFSASHDRMLHSLSSIDLSKQHSINTDACLAKPIEDYTGAFSGSPFIFIAYAHGVEDALLIGTERYLHLENSYFFAETIFYACGCLSAQKLMPKLRSERCRVVLGYDAKISSNNPECDPVFQDCENAFLSNFLTTSDTVQDSLKYMYKKYNEMGKYLRSTYDSFTAGVLEGNLAAFKLNCSEEDKNMTKEDFLGFQNEYPT